jgi:iron complex outermembrane recepter protein
MTNKFEWYSRTRALIWAASALILIGSDLASGEAVTDQPAAPASGQQAPSSSTSIEEIVVTARRRDENLQEVPIAVSALTGSKLENLNVTTAEDLQFHVPNLTVKNSDAGADTPVFLLRGQKQTLFTEENVATYFADVPQDTRAIALNLYDLQSVQVIRGPQGTLFGRDSDGGVVVFTPVRPDLTAFGGYIEAQTGNYADARVTTVLNMPVTNELAVRLDGAYENRGGYVQNLAAGQRDLGTLDNYSFRPSILFAPTDSIENLTVVDVEHRNEIPDPYRLTGIQGGLTPLPLAAFGIHSPLTLAGLLNPIVAEQNALGLYKTYAITDGNVNGYRGGEQLHMDAYGLSNVTKFEFPDAITFKNIVGVRHEQSHSATDITGLEGFGPSGIPAGLPAEALPAQLGEFYSIQHVTQITEEAELSGISFNKSLSWVVGIFYEHNHAYSDIYNEVQLGQYPLAANPNDQLTVGDTDTLAGYFQGTYDFSALGAQGLRFTAGGRTEEERLSSTYTEHGGYYGAYNGTGCGLDLSLYPNCISDRAATFRTNSWNLTLDYQLNSSVLSYVARRRGIKGGGFNSSTDIPEYFTYKPESLTDWEVGTKVSNSIFGMRYQLNADVYTGDYQDIQTQDVISGSNGALGLIQVNAASATLKGVEADGSIELTHNLLLDVTFSAEDGRYKNGSDIPVITNGVVGTPVSLGGTPFGGVPKYQASIDATYQIPGIPSNVGDVTVTAGYSWRSDSPALVQTGTGAIDEYGVANAQLAWNHIYRSPFIVTLWVKNLADKGYFTSCNNNTAVLGYIACQVGEPRTFGITVRRNF